MAPTQGMDRAQAIREIQEAIMAVPVGPATMTLEVARAIMGEAEFLRRMWEAQGCVCTREPSACVEARL